MSVEDRLRTAAGARANLVTAIRPLELPAREPIRLRPAPGPRRWVAWAAPAAAAALVVGLAVTLVSIRQAGHQSSAPSVAAGRSGGSVTSFAGVPKYYAALYDPSGTAFNDETTAQPVELVVGQTGSSQRLATVTPPSGQSFVGVTAEESDTAFIVAAEPFPVGAGMNSLPAVAWYVVRIAPGHGQGATGDQAPHPRRAVRLAGRRRGGVARRHQARDHVPARRLERQPEPGRADVEHLLGRHRPGAAHLDPADQGLPGQATAGTGAGTPTAP